MHTIYLTACNRERLRQTKGAEGQDTHYIYHLIVGTKTAFDTVTWNCVGNAIKKTHKVNKNCSVIRNAVLVLLLA